MGNKSGRGIKRPFYSKKKEEKMFETLTMETQKVCNRCGKLKNLAAFPIDKRIIGGHSGICRQCKNSYYRREYRKDPKKLYLRHT